MIDHPTQAHTPPTPTAAPIPIADTRGDAAVTRTVDATTSAVVPTELDPAPTTTDSPVWPSRGIASTVVHRQHLITALRYLGDLLDRPGFELDAALREMNQIGVVAVPGALHAGITVDEGAGHLATWGATHPDAAILDDAQRDARDGPGLTAARTQTVIEVPDLGSDPRWPTFCDLARHRTPVRSLLSLGLFDPRQRRCAAVNFYATTAGAFTDQSRGIALIHAALTALAHDVIVREHQFAAALRSRDVIGQAKGMLMQQFDLSGPAAFDLLNRQSQTSNTKLVAIAAELTTRRQTPSQTPQQAAGGRPRPGPAPTSKAVSR